MSKRFKQVLEEASKRVAEWPDWKKSEELKLSEELLESKKTKRTEVGERQQRVISAVAGK